MNSVYVDDDDSKPCNSRRMSSVGKLALTLTGGIGLGVSIISFSFLLPVLRKHCLPYMPATDAQLGNILKVLQNDIGGKLLDIGSGDGRIVIASSKCGIESHGVELNPWLVLFSKLNAYRKGVSNLTRFYKRDLWNFNLQPYDNIVIFGVNEMMKDIETKILNECREGSQIIACRFPLPHLVPFKIIGTGIDTVWVYRIKKL